jgi:hypothetical protein
MAAIDIKVFSGLRPLIDPLLLETPEAVVADNVQLTSGTLAPLLGTTTLRALTKTSPKTIWRYGTSANENEHWLEFLAETDVMASPLPEDIWGRAYWTDGVKPKYGPSTAIVSGSSYPGVSYDLGIPVPSVTPLITGTAPSVAANSESRTVVITYVSAYGEEGAPSPASIVSTLDPAASATYSNLGTAPAGAYNITNKRIYRSSTVGSSAQFQFVAEIPVGQTSYTDTINQANLGEILPSENWTAPPDALQGLRMLANGAAIGFVGNTAYLSEPNLPHAWPHKYPIDFQIVGVAAIDQSAVLLTSGYPFVLDGADPSAMTPRRLNMRQACVSRTSIVETEGGVLYASPDGLVAIDSGGASLVSTKHYSRKQWQALNPSSFRAFSHDGRYIALYTKTDSSRGMLIFDPTGQGPFHTTSSQNAATAITAAYSDPRTDTLYLAQGGNIIRYNAGSPLAYTWRSKPFRLATKINFGVAAIEAAAFPVTLKVYADGVLKQTKTVTSREPFKLKSGFKALQWQFEITGTNEVKRLRVATSGDELKQLQ